MGTIIIQNRTCKDPITCIGEEAGICWNSNINDPQKNYQRGLQCIRNNHGRTLEFPMVYMIMNQYSAKVMREYYTHIGGSPTRLQESTRYVNYSDFNYITPPSIEIISSYKDKYDECMNKISETIDYLISNGVPNEDATMLLPLGMQTKVVVKTNLRQLIDMSRQRMCSRAYWEFRLLMKDLCQALSDYSDEWRIIVDECFHAKCEEYKFCTESKGCRKYPPKD